MPLLSKRRLAYGLAALTGLIAALAVAVQPAQAATGIHVVNGVLVEANGTPLTLRGINHPHTWFTSQTSSYANIKATGANSVRVVLSSGRWQPAETAADVANVVNLCKTNKLICVLENHDTTGYNEQQNEWTLDRSVTWWNSVRDALIGQENYVIINIGNEPFGNGSNPVSSSAWTEQTAAAVQRLRSLGFEHTIMVDAPNWGQDWQFIMRDTAPTVRNADPTGNIVFSVHMYGVFDTAAEINAYVDSFTSRGLALCICEFGFSHSDGNPDEDAIMAKAEAAGIGLMGWSWSGNSGGVEYLDMVTNFNPSQRTSWGTRFITGANGLSTTATEATIYGDSSPQVPGPPGTLTASSTSPTSVTLSWGASSGPVANYQIERAIGASSTTFTQIGTSTTTSFTDTGLTTGTVYRYQVRATNSMGASPYSNIVNVGVVIDPPPPGNCTYRLDQWAAGYVAYVTVNGPRSGWSIPFTVNASDTIINSWNASISPSSGANRTATNLSYNGNLSAGQSSQWGFQANRSAGGPLPTFPGCTAQ